MMKVVRLDARVRAKQLLSLGCFEDGVLACTTLAHTQNLESPHSGEKH